MARMPNVDLFWKKVNKTESCWLWTGSKMKIGYGTMGVYDKSAPSKTRCYYVHRLSWYFHFGDVPAGLHVLHKCDTPLCVNPSHLFLGTHRDNMADRKSKGRYANVAAAATRPKLTLRKLTFEQAQEIRKLSFEGARQIDIARLYDVSDKIIYKILTNKTYRN